MLPGIDECVELGPWRGTVAPDGTAGYAAQIRMLFDPAVTGWVRDQPSGLPEMRGYFGLREEREPDALLLALAVDGLPPVVFGLGATGWAPTVELTMYMRMVPAPGPLRVAARCRHVSGGWFDEEAEVWDSAGNLVAQSRQIARVGRGRPRRRLRLAAAAAFPATPTAHRCCCINGDGPSLLPGCRGRGAAADALDPPDEGGPDRGGDGRARVQRRVAAERDEERGEQAADGGRPGDRDVDQAEVLAPVLRARQDLRDQRLVDRQVRAESGPEQERGDHHRRPRLDEGQQQRGTPISEPETVTISFRLPSRSETLPPTIAVTATQSV